ncbi:sensor histidine kinase [Zhihengliuella halotolerans]|uniref:histidine kinase n=1 Tax=Zhihengliuella halotolerans TaxID=370736 RepID=A0A4Q8AG91_9MICC|nr:histidine kinase [Zhihengliuella halotolerans]RZU63380.1 signal transduction histidine kinase [Zhihengliuella halotolerans]
MATPLPGKHLQTVVTLTLSSLLVAAGWTGVFNFGWWAPEDRPAVWWHLVPLAFMALPMLGKHRRPVTCLVATVPIVMADVALGGSVGIWLCVADLIYHVGLRASPRAVRVVATVFALCCAAVVVASGAVQGLQAAVGAGVTVVALLLMPLWWAAEVRRGYPLWPQAYARDELEAERNAALKELHKRERHAAIEAERRGMARELHDTVSAEISAIALTAGAALAGGADEARDRRALGTIRIASVAALESLRSMVNLLRGSELKETAADLLAEPGPDWDETLRRAERLGLDVVHRGRPPADLHPRVQHALTRAAGEALHNAAKHGTGDAAVVVTADEESVSLSVDNGLAESGAATADGTGLIGMRERVTAVGGVMTAGPAGDGARRWRVEIEVPSTTTGPGGGAA